MANLILLGLINSKVALCIIGLQIGIIVMAAVIMPGVKGTLGAGPETKKVMTNIKKKMNTLVWISIIGLLVTAILLSQSSPLFGGIFSIANEYSIFLTIKHVVIAVMVINVIFRGHLLPRMNMLPPREEKFSKLLMVINLILGIVVLLLSGFLAASQVIEYLPAV